jgi:hypothetical protein
MELQKLKTGRLMSFFISAAKQQLIIKTIPDSRAEFPGTVFAKTFSI